jgi:hypothetical protein
VSDGNEIQSGRSVGEFCLVRMENVGKFDWKVDWKFFIKSLRQVKNQKYIKGIEKRLLDVRKAFRAPVVFEENVLQENLGNIS